MITHDLDTLYEITDRIAVIADKKVVATGSVQELEKNDHPWIQDYFMEKIRRLRLPGCLPIFCLRSEFARPPSADGAWPSQRP